MACDNGCNDCKCEPIEIELGNRKSLIAKFSDKLRILHDFSCLFSLTPCDQLGRVSAKYVFYLWCYLKDVMRLLEKVLIEMDTYLTKAEAERIYQKKLVAGDHIRINGNVISTDGLSTVQDLTKTNQELAKTNKALNKIIDNLKASGAWQGGIDGGFTSGRNIATGNINVFGGSPDGNSFIRTNSGKSENDLAGGV